MPAIVSGGSVSRFNVRCNLVGSDGVAKEPQKSLKARGNQASGSDLIITSCGPMRIRPTQATRRGARLSTYMGFGCTLHPLQATCCHESSSFFSEPRRNESLARRVFLLRVRRDSETGSRVDSNVTWGRRDANRTMTISFAQIDLGYTMDLLLFPSTSGSRDEDDEEDDARSTTSWQNGHQRGGAPVAKRLRHQVCCQSLCRRSALSLDTS